TGVFDGPRRQEPAWLRLLGVQSFGLAMLMVLVAHRVEQLWWWSWAFALVAMGTAAVATFHAAFGLRPHESSAPWWLFSAATSAGADPGSPDRPGSARPDAGGRARPRGRARWRGAARLRFPWPGRAAGPPTPAAPPGRCPPRAGSPGTSPPGGRRRSARR